LFSEIGPEIRALSIVIVAFVAFQAIESFITALLSGWMELARRCRAETEPTVHERLDEPITIRLPRITSHSFALKVRFLPIREGLHLSAPFFHRIGRSPLLVPWEDVRTNRPALVVPGPSELLLGDGGQLRLRVNDSLRRRIALWKSRATSGQVPPPVQ
jgi:hypothetical protein